MGSCCCCCCGKSTDESGSDKTEGGAAAAPPLAHPVYSTPDPTTTATTATAATAESRQTEEESEQPHEADSSEAATVHTPLLGSAGSKAAKKPKSKSSIAKQRAQPGPSPAPAPATAPYAYQAIGDNGPTADRAKEKDSDKDKAKEKDRRKDKEENVNGRATEGLTHAHGPNTATQEVDSASPATPIVSTTTPFVSTALASPIVSAIPTIVATPATPITATPATPITATPATPTVAVANATAAAAPTERPIETPPPSVGLTAKEETAMEDEHAAARRTPSPTPSSSSSTSSARKKKKKKEHSTTAEEEKGHRHEHGHGGEIFLKWRYRQSDASLKVIIDKARNLPAVDFDGSSDPYAKLKIVDDSTSHERKPKALQSFKTHIHSNTLNPLFEETARFSVKGLTTPQYVMYIGVWDHEKVGSNREMSSVTVPLESLLKDNGAENEKWFRLKISSAVKEKTPKVRSRSNSEDRAALASRIVLRFTLDSSKRDLTVEIVRAKHLVAVGPDGTSSPYVTVEMQKVGDPSAALEDDMKYRTKTVPKELNPFFEESFQVDWRKLTSRQALYEISVIVWDDRGHLHSGREMGLVKIPIADIQKRLEKFDTFWDKYKLIAADSVRDLYPTLIKIDRDEESPAVSDLPEMPMGLPRISVDESSMKSTSDKKDADSEPGDNSAISLSLSYRPEASVLQVGVERAVHLPAVDHGGTSDPYVKMLVSDGDRIKLEAKTKVKKKTLDAEYNENFTFNISAADFPKMELTIQVWDNELMKDRQICHAVVPLKNVGPAVQSSWYLLDTSDAQQLHQHHLKLKSPKREKGKNKGDEDETKEALVDKTETDAGSSQVCLDISCTRLGAKDTFNVLVKEARNLPAVDKDGVANPFVKLSVFPKLSLSDRDTTHKTKTIKDTLDPTFNERWKLELPSSDSADRSLRVELFGKERFREDRMMGSVDIPLSQFVDGTTAAAAAGPQWYHLSMSAEMKKKVKTADSPTASSQFDESPNESSEGKTPLAADITYRTPESARNHILTSLNIKKGKLTVTARLRVGILYIASKSKLEVTLGEARDINLSLLDNPNETLLVSVQIGKPNPVTKKPEEKTLEKPAGATVAFNETLRFHMTDEAFAKKSLYVTLRSAKEDKKVGKAIIKLTDIDPRKGFDKWCELEHAVAENIFEKAIGGGRSRSRSNSVESKESASSVASSTPSKPPETLPSKYLNVEFSFSGLANKLKVTLEDASLLKTGNYFVKVSIYPGQNDGDLNSNVIEGAANPSFHQDLQFSFPPENLKNRHVHFVAFHQDPSEPQGKQTAVGVAEIKLGSLDIAAKPVKSRLVFESPKLPELRSTVRYAESEGKFYVTIHEIKGMSVLNENIPVNPTAIVYFESDKLNTLQRFLYVFRNTANLACEENFVFEESMLRGKMDASNALVIAVLHEEEGGRRYRNLGVWRRSVPDIVSSKEITGWSPLELSPQSTTASTDDYMQAQANF